MRLCKATEGEDGVRGREGIGTFSFEIVVVFRFGVMGG